MLKQLDPDRNLVLVLSAQETGRLMEIMSASLDSVEMGLSPVTPEAMNFWAQIQATCFLFTDDELVEAMVAPHLNHPGDNVEKLREMYARTIPSAREATIRRDLALPSGE